jgi:hypothetical protein
MNGYQNIDDGRTVISRKDHKCEWCNQAIPKRARCIKRTYKWDLELINAHMHVECFPAMLRYISQSMDGEFCPGEHRRGEVGEGPV